MREKVKIIEIEYKDVLINYLKIISVPFLSRGIY